MTTRKSRAAKHLREAVFHSLMAQLLLAPDEADAAKTLASLRKELLLIRNRLETKEESA